MRFLQCALGTSGTLFTSGNGRVYAVYGDGTNHSAQGCNATGHGVPTQAYVCGWPAKVVKFDEELLPYVGSGVDTPPALGSRSTYVRGALGGLRGRALRKADQLPLGAVRGARVGRVRAGGVPDYSIEPEIRVVLGPQDDRFTKKGIAAFLEGPYEMLPQSDRMGARLKGPFIEHTGGHDIISDGVALGGIQVIGDGQPIVLLVDRQSTGGYTKIATVCSFDIGRIGQVKPGQRLRFRKVTIVEAHAELRARREQLESAVE